MIKGGEANSQNRHQKHRRLKRSTIIAEVEELGLRSLTLLWFAFFLFAATGRPAAHPQDAHRADVHQPPAPCDRKKDLPAWQSRRLLSPLSGLAAAPSTRLTRMLNFWVFPDFLFSNRGWTFAPV